MSRKMMLVSMMAAGVFTLGASAGVVAAAPAGDAEEVKVEKLVVSRQEPASPIQVGFWFGVPAYTEKNKVHGFRLGFPFSGTSQVSGLDLSLFGSHIAKLDGAQISIGYCGTKGQSYGLQAAFGVCMNHEHFDGTQVALFNQAVVTRGWQAGGANLSNDVNGGQVGLANIVGHLRGFQAGIVNVVARSIGPQIGLVNYADQSSFQLGVININRKSGMPFMILFNYCK